MPRSSLLKNSRLIHQYFGIFISPALIFFAFTGALQTFGLHEINRDHPNYKPAHWIAVLAQIHKKQVATLPVRRPQPAVPATGAGPAPASPVVPAADGAPGQDHTRRHRSDTAAADQNSQPAAPGAQPAAAPPAAPAARNPLPLRIFFLIVCVGLFTSTITGLIMSYMYARNRTAITATLIAGILLPLLLLLF